MSVLQIFQILRRHFVVVLIGLLLILAASWRLGSADPVYSTQVDLLFLPPSQSTQPNAYSGGSEVLVTAAGVVASELAGTEQQERTTALVSLVELGVYRGSWVVLPNDGGQWAINYTRPVLTIQVTGSSPAEVRTALDRLLGRIESTVRRMEGSDVTDNNRIRLRVSPAAPRVIEHSGSRLQATAASTVLGMGLLTWALIAYDRRAHAGRSPTDSDHTNDGLRAT